MRSRPFKHNWQTLAKRAGLRDFLFHDLRHDFASRLVQAGVNLYEVKDPLGHSSIVTERYARLAAHHTHAAAAMRAASA